MKAKTTRRALLMSIVSLLLCMSMLVGTTFAWFTDSVTSANNIISAGNLDVELYYQVEGQSDWTKVTEGTNVFMENALWEPGHTEVVKLKVVNEGTLALKYQLGVNIAGETGSKDAKGNEFKLSDYIKFGIVDGNQTYTREQAVAAVDATATALKTAYNTETIELHPKADDNTAEDAYTDIVTVVVYMPTSVGNEANHGKGEAVPTINLGINLFATQFTYEEDSFGKDYDKDVDKDIVYSVEELERKYNFTYFTSLSDALNAANAGSFAEGTDTKDETASAGAYIDETGKSCVVLLKDTALEERLRPTADMTLNLGGHKLSASDILCINVQGGNFTIDGRLPGSGIVHTGTAGTIGCVQVPASSTAESLTILGGTYTVNNTASGAAVALNLKSKTCVTNVSNATIFASTTDNKANGIVNDGITIVTNCNIRAYSNYNLLDSNYTAVSYGVWNTGTLTMTDSDAYGVHSGISTTGPIDVNGGTFEGFGHGGMYIGSEGVVAKIRNATLKDSATMLEGYTNTAPHNGAGMYIGGADNIKVYMDNCDVFGSNQPIVLRGTSGEQNISLYISNSTINTDQKIRIDNETHHLYIGTGNNFTSDNTNLPTAVTHTNEAYK